MVISWGVRLYENYAAEAVRDDWLDRIRLGASPRAATNEAIEACRACDDPANVWIALADTQWTWGRLEARVLKEARRALKAGPDLERWTDPKEIAARTRVLEQVAARLAKRPPAPKPIKVVGETLDWKVGQLWAYCTVNRRWVVFGVTAVNRGYGLAPAPMLELLDVVLDSPSTRGVSLTRVRLRKARSGWDSDPKRAAIESPMFQACVKVRGELPRDRLRRLSTRGNPRPPEPMAQAIGVPWSVVDVFLADVFRVGGARVEPRGASPPRSSKRPSP